MFELRGAGGPAAARRRSRRASLSTRRAAPAGTARYLAASRARGRTAFDLSPGMLAVARRAPARRPSRGGGRAPRSRCRTPRPTWSSTPWRWPTSRTSGRCSPRRPGCCVRAAASSSPTPAAHVPRLGAATRWSRRPPDGRVGYLPTWRHGVGEYLRAALAHGFEARACEEPVREPMDADDWDPPERPTRRGAGEHLGPDAVRAARRRGRRTWVRPALAGLGLPALRERGGRLSTGRRFPVDEATRSLWTTPGTSVDDTPELEVCREKVPKPLVGVGFQAIELSSRTSSGESGIGRRRRSLRCSASLLDEGRGGQVTEAAGVGGEDWIDRERHQYRSMVRGRGLACGGSPVEGPL